MQRASSDQGVFQPRLGDNVRAISEVVPTTPPCAPRSFWPAAVQTSSFSPRDALSPDSSESVCFRSLTLPSRDCPGSCRQRAHRAWLQFGLRHSAILFRLAVQVFAEAHEVDCRLTVAVDRCERQAAATFFESIGDLSKETDEGRPDKFDLFHVDHEFRWVGGLRKVRENRQMAQHTLVQMRILGTQFNDTLA